MTDPDREEQRLLTVSEFLRLAADRGKTLRLELGDGWMVVTDGRKMYVLPDDPREGLPPNLMESLCRRFDLPRLDFALDGGDDD